MKFLKQSTSAVIVFGPALLPADGVTLVTSLVSALDHASTGIFLHKNGGAGTIRHATVTATTYDSYGNYLVTLDTTDTNTLGRLRAMFAAAANTLPIWEDFTVLPANVFDSLVSGSTDLKVDVDQIKTQTVTCAAGVTVLASVGTAATSTAQTGDGYARLGAPAGASVSADVAAVKVDTAAVKAQTDKLTFTVANQVDSNVLDWKSATAPAMTGDAFARLGAPAGASVSADIAAVKVDTAAVKVQTDKLTFTVANQVDSNVLDWKSATAPAMTGDAFARLGAPAGASVSADVAAVKVDTAAVKVKTDSLTFTVAGQADANVIDWKSATAPAMTGDSFARLGAPAGASVSADVAAVKVDTAAVKVQTDKFVFTVANQVDSNVIDWKGATAPAMTGDAYARLGAPVGASISVDIAALPTATLNADALLKRDMSAVSGEAARSPLNAFRALRNKVAVAAGTMTVRKEDDTTSAWTAVVTTDAAAVPIVTIDPA